MFFDKISNGHLRSCRGIVILLFCEVKCTLYKFIANIRNKLPQKLEIKFHKL